MVPRATGAPFAQILQHHGQSVLYMIKEYGGAPVPEPGRSCALPGDRLPGPQAPHHLIGSLPIAIWPVRQAAAFHSEAGRRDRRWMAALLHLHLPVGSAA